MSLRQSQTGFTLIELVVVIIVLGILAVVALPRFINLTPEAKSAALEAQYAAFEDAVRLYHSGYLTGGHSGAIDNLATFGDGTVDSTANGWPYATEGTATHLFNACEQLWHGLTSTDLSIAYVVDADLPTTDADIAYTYASSPRTCIYRASYFIQRNEPTLIMEYQVDSGQVTVRRAHWQPQP
ncbi:prepilin-type N-terminal cleavage/methylation domain-containing protein [Shewanella zhuhaiensis]|uniref:prepilin-type N-terminal cleavage/methylation domain-containing protein n=1 Tax=Shewanella zhuhaiensis TaxID=2919576 RepID=UPI0023E7D8BB|nr:type II secretion system protein [Shewanella zhuhaiensis]